LYLRMKMEINLGEIRLHSTLDELLFLSLVQLLKGLIFALAGCEAARMWYFMCLMV